MKNTCFKSQRRPAMTDYPLILGENLSFSNTIHQIPRHFVLNFDFKRKLNSPCSHGENVDRILILRAGLRAKSLLFFKKKKKEMPTYLLKFWIWKNGNQDIFLSWPKCVSERCFLFVDAPCIIQLKYTRNRQDDRPGSGLKCWL